MLIFGLHSTSDDQPGWSMDSNPICHPLQPKIHFLIMFNFRCLAGLVDGLKPHLPLLSSLKMKCSFFGLCSTSDDSLGQLMDSNPICHPSIVKKNEMLIFGLCSISDDRPGWLMDLNAIHHPSPAKKNEMLVFGLCSTSDDRPGWSMDLNPIHHPSAAKK